MKVSQKLIIWLAVALDPKKPMRFWQALIAMPVVVIVAIIGLIFVGPWQAGLPILVALILYVGLVREFQTLVVHVQSWVAGGAHNRALAFAIAVVFAAICYGFRNLQKHVYGLFEIAFGITCLWEGLNPTRSGETATALVLGGVFVVVRGVDNTRAGWREGGYFEKVKPSKVPANESVDGEGI